jgi:hypothetical protein
MKKLAIIGAFLAVCIAFILASPVLAGGLSVSGGKIDVTVNPGSNSTQIMNVENTSDTAMNIVVDVEGYGESASNDFVVLSPADDTGLYSARSWLSVSPSSFSLAPGGSQPITVTINVPIGTGSGGRYAIVMIQTVPASGQQVATVSAVAARVLLTVNGYSTDTSSQITAVEPVPSTSGNTAGVMVTAANNGNYDYTPQIQTTLKNVDKVIATSDFVHPGWPILPGFSRQYQMTFTGQGTIPAGKYQVDVTVKDDAGNVITSTTAPVQFTTKQVLQTTTITGTASGAAPGASTITVVQKSGANINWTIIVVAVIGGIIVIVLLVLVLQKRKTS